MRTGDGGQEKERVEDMHAAACAWMGGGWVDAEGQQEMQETAWRKRIFSSRAFPSRPTLGADGGTKIGYHVRPTQKCGADHAGVKSCLDELDRVLTFGPRFKP